MRSTVWLVVGVVVLAVLGVGYGVFRSPGTVPTSSPTPGVEDVELTESPGSGQFLQVAPTTLPQEVRDAEPIANDSLTPPNAGAKVSISITEQGFSQTAVTVPVGAMVTFMNDGQSEHWPASDVHPTHEILPDFDAKRGLQTGETYSYTFTQAGTWPFHDHLNPSAKGTITVSSE